MQSADPEIMPERVMFSDKVLAEGPVEHWLTSIQDMMVRSLYDISKQAYHEYPIEKQQ